MLKVRFWWHGSPILCRLVPYLRGMGHVYGATTPPLFRCRRRGRKSDGGGGAEAAHGAASLSRQIRDLEYEVGAQLMIRSAHGIELTAAGRVFLDHARLALAQVDGAREAARRAAQPAKLSFALGL